MSYEIFQLSDGEATKRADIVDALKINTLPTMILYDEAGLQLFEEITYNKHYYLTNSEIDILQTNSAEIAQLMRESIIIELGSGNLRKTLHILRAIETLGLDTEYYALDLDEKELDRSLAALTKASSFRHIKLYGLHAEYKDVEEFIRKQKRRVSILWMGSSVGNFDRSDAAAFLLSLQKSMKPGDTMLIGVDHRNDPELIHNAYNDPDGVSESFELNGLKNANRILGSETFKEDEWKYEGIYDAEKGRHEAFFYPVVDVTIEPGLIVKKDTRIRIERSYKYSPDEVATLFDEAQLHVVHQWTDSKNLYSSYFVSVPPAYFSSKATDLSPLPTLTEWEELWKLWDLITLDMIPDRMLHTKPIDLRNPCIFYIGHIPTFLDIHLSRVGNGKYTNSSYTQIFERGIDPDVDDPTNCHDHSQLPDTWPDLSELLEFRDKVRCRLRQVYKSDAINDRKTARAIFTVYEHEAMHAETLLYMLIQSDSTLAPPGIVPAFPKPKNEIGPATWIDMPSTELIVGMNDIEGQPSGAFFGWDNEKPERKMQVSGFQIQSRPITNGEYAKFIRQAGGAPPKSWTQDCRVRTFFGSIPMAVAVNWPVAASYNELARYAKWIGARLPTYGELRTFYNQALEKQLATSGIVTNGHVTNGHAINGHMTNGHATNGHLTNGSVIQNSFYDLHGHNVNFQTWLPAELKEHPNPQIYSGVWEWTSTDFAATPGFQQSKIYPGYSVDFFDEKHNIILGGSFATIARIAGRKSFVNWYQRNYEYCWTGARLVKDT